MIMRWKQTARNEYVLVSKEATFDAVIYLNKDGYYRIIVSGQEQPERFLKVEQAKRWLKRVSG